MKREEREEKAVQSHKKGVQEWRRKHRERKEQWGILLSPIVKGYFLSQGANPASISIFMSPVSGAWQSMSLPHLVTYVRTRTHTQTHTQTHTLPLFSIPRPLSRHTPHTPRSRSQPHWCLCVFMRHAHPYRALSNTTEPRTAGSTSLIYQSTLHSFFKMNFPSSLLSCLSRLRILAVIMWPCAA